MTAVNAVVNRVFDVILGPLGVLPPIAALSIISLLTAIGLLIAVRLTSNQQALAAVKRQMYGDLLEMRLFNDDLRAMWRAQLCLLGHNGSYLRLSLAPMLWTFVPLVVLTVQLHCYFGYAGVSVGMPVLVTAVMKSLDATSAGATESHRADEQPDLILDLPQGIHTETPAIWFAALRQAVWRVVPDATGDYVLRLRTGGSSYEKTLHVSDGLARRSPLRVSPRLLDQVLYPSEPPLPELAPVASLGIEYPERSITIFGWQLRWSGLYVTLSIVFFVVLKPPFRVTL